jgi:acetolactate synthase-1/2/3 large subunit
LAPDDFEKFKPQAVASDKVNLLEFYQKINKLWKKPTLCFEDVCTAYRDRQYVLPIPDKNVQFFSSQDGSAMGGALGIGLGAKLAAPQKHCFIFMGDGCSRLVFGALPELADLGIVVFVLNNQSLGIVDEVYQKIYADVEQKKYHIKLATVDFVGLAKACSWEAEKLKPDLSNLESLMDKAYSSKRSFLIEIPCESFQSLGFNPRKLILK